MMDFCKRSIIAFSFIYLTLTEKINGDITNTGYPADVIKIRLRGYGTIICQNGRTFAIGMNSTRCICTRGFTGERYEIAYVLYWSFNTFENLTVMEALRVGNSSGVQVEGLIDYAVRTNVFPFGWINLGRRTEACMTRPETCGAAGGAISVWFRVIAPFGSIVSTYSGRTTGSGILYFRSGLRYDVTLPDGYFVIDVEIPTGWVNAVLNFKGSDGEQGISVYNNGAHIGTNTTKINVDERYEENNRQIDIGRLIGIRGDVFYATVEVDELSFYNRYLTDEEIASLNQI